MAKVFISDKKVIAGGSIDLAAELINSAESTRQELRIAAAVDTALGTLTNIERSVLQARMGLEGPSLSRAAVAEAIGSSVRQVEELEAGALRALYAPRTSEALKTEI